MSIKRTYIDVAGRCYEPEQWETDNYSALAEAEAESLRYKQLYENQCETVFALQARIRKLEKETG